MSTLKVLGIVFGKISLIIMLFLFLVTAFVPATSYASPWTDVWNSIRSLILESSDHEERINDLESSQRGVKVYDANNELIGPLVEIESSSQTVNVFIPSLGRFYTFGIEPCHREPLPEEPVCSSGFNKHFYGYDYPTGLSFAGKIYFSDQNCEGIPYFDFDDERVSYYQSAYFIITYTDYHGERRDYQVDLTATPVQVRSVHEYNPRTYPRNTCFTPRDTVEIKGLMLTPVEVPFNHNPVALPLGFE